MSNVYGSRGQALFVPDIGGLHLRSWCSQPPSASRTPAARGPDFSAEDNLHPSSCSGPKLWSRPWLPPFSNCCHQCHQEILLALPAEASRHLTLLPILLAWPFHGEAITVSHLDPTSASHLIAPLLPQLFPLSGQQLGHIVSRFPENGAGLCAAFPGKASTWKTDSRTHMLWPLSLSSF